MIQGVHAIGNGVTLKPGDIIKSNDSTYRYYDVLWPIYKEVADDLGLFFPETYGYAYPVGKHSGILVESNGPVVKGYNEKSIGYVGAWMGVNSFIRDVPRSMPLEERLALRKIRIKEFATGYFFPPDDRYEMLAEKWVVVS